MAQSRQSLYLVGTMLVLIMAGGIGYLWYQNKLLTSKPSPTLNSLQNTALPEGATVARIQNGMIADTPLLGVLELGPSRIPTISGLIESVDLLDIESDSYPAQYYVTLQHETIPQARFRVTIGHPEYVMLVRYQVDRTTAGSIAEENLRVSEVVSMLKEGDLLTVDLGFPNDQPEVRAEFMNAIKAYELSLQEGEVNPFNVHLFRVEKLGLQES